MAKSIQDKTPETFDMTNDELLPAPGKINLRTLDDIRLETARIYRDMRSGRLETSEGTKLCYVLIALGKMIESSEIENRIKILESRK